MLLVNKRYGDVCEIGELYSTDSVFGCTLLCRRVKYKSFAFEFWQIFS